MSEHFEDSMGQQELPCDKCGKCCYLMDKVDACYTQLLVAEVLRLRGVIATVWDLMDNSNSLEKDLFFYGDGSKYFPYDSSFMAMFDTRGEEE
tara:strand:+ start:332 stop:610 length:279 start_codon:yes stop_codon:yes gene_type:complete